MLNHHSSSGRKSPAAEAFRDARLAFESRRVYQALEFYTVAEELGFEADECAAGRWSCHMLLGHFPDAWNESDAIQQRGNPDPNRFWSGEPLAERRVLIRCLHGLGDTLQYVRYAPLLRRQAAALTIEAQPPLKQLLAQADLADNVVTWGDPEPEWDRQIEIVELPRIFRTTISTIPNGVPYLQIGAPAVRQNASETLRVGIVWTAGYYDPTRSVPLDQIAHLAGMPGVEFFSFQAGPEREQLLRYPDRIRDLYDESGCILAAARRLLTMHVLVTVDTMMAHLGGALGMPVWMLLPYAADWRWMLSRRDSPWYPTMRLFRQERPGDWASAVSLLELELRQLAIGSALPLSS